MDLNQFFSSLSGAPSGAFNSRHFDQGPFDEVRELAHRGLKLFPVSLAAKLAGEPDRLIASATDDIPLLEELSAAAQPLSGYRLAIGQSGLSIWRLDGHMGITSFASLAPDLDESLTTLQARRGDSIYVLFRWPAGMKRIGSARKLLPGVSILGDGAGFDMPPTGGAVWTNPGTEIETLPYVLRQLLGPEDDPDTTPGRAILVPKLPPRPLPCRPAARFPQLNQAPRKDHPICGQAGWRGGYRIYRQR